MNIFGLRIPFTKGLSQVTDISPLLPARSAGVIGLIRESFAGAWQRNVDIDDRGGILANSAVFACVSRISNDIAKLRIRLMERQGKIWAEVERNSPFWTVLRKPNKYQTRVQFFVAWLSSKLTFGNTYILKVRDGRRIVVEMHVIDPRKVTPIITEDGDVYYQINRDELAQVESIGVTVPASEIIHDRGLTLFHPLIGVSPIFACGLAATQGNRIQANSTVFFQNMSRAGGVLTAPDEISEETAKRIKDHWESNYSGVNAGRIAVLGDGLKYEAMTVNAVDAELVSQLRWTGEDVARAFGIPGYKIGVGQMPSNNNVASLNQQYYDDTLQILIEGIELLLDEGLGLNPSNVEGEMGTEFDLDGLLRMDITALYESLGKGVKDGWLKPNEARQKVNLGPVDGGDTPYLQQQNFSLAALSKRDALPDPFATAKPDKPTPAASEEDIPDDVVEEARSALEQIRKGLDLETI